LSAAYWLKETTGAPTGIGEHIVEVQALRKTIYGLDGSQWNKILADGERFTVGCLPAEVIFRPAMRRPRSLM
jgi:hypothetical protein